MINAKMLSNMRSFVDSVLPDTCVVYTQSNVSDGAGGYSKQLVASGTIACRIDPIKETNQLDYTADRESLRRKWMLTMPSSATISKSNLLLINGVNYNVVTIYDGHSWSVSSRAEIVESVQK